MLLKWFRLQHVIINIKYIRQYGIYRLIKLMGRGLLRLLVSERVNTHTYFFSLNYYIYMHRWARKQP